MTSKGLASILEIHYIVSMPHYTHGVYFAELYRNTANVCYFLHLELFLENKVAEAIFRIVLATTIHAKSKDFSLLDIKSDNE